MGGGARGFSLAVHQNQLIDIAFLAFFVFFLFITLLLRPVYHVDERPSYVTTALLLPKN